MFGDALTGSARHLYVVCIYGAICLQIQKYFPPDRAVFSPKNDIFILLYVVSRFMKKNSRFHGKVARYDVLEIKFVTYRTVHTIYVEISSSSRINSSRKIFLPSKIFGKVKKVSEIWLTTVPRDIAGNR
jgi:hypothetical protein